MDKLLPIKVIHKRKVDEQLTEAGGSKTQPKWVLLGPELIQHAQQLTDSVVRVTAAYEAHKAEHHELPMVMATSIKEEAIAKTHRGDIVALLNSDKQSNVIGVGAASGKEATEENKNSARNQGKSSTALETRMLLSVVTTDELLANISRAMQDTQNSAKLISSITDIVPYEPSVSEYNPKNKAYRVIPIDYLDSHRNELAQQLFRNKCAASGIEINRETRYSPDMRMFRITLDNIEELETVRCFEGVYSIEETTPIHVALDTLDNFRVPSIKIPEEGKAYPVVGVLDSGIERNPFLAPWILEENEEYYAPELQDKSHGSMVSSIVGYNDELNGTAYASTDGVKMLEAVIIPDAKKETAYPEDVLDNVRDAIERHKDIKIWTMSVGTSEECALDSFSQYGMALDNIADENNVLIIKSAGNSTTFIQGREQERIAKMADSVRALVVGSIAGDKGPHDFAEINAPSPFTRHGPGPAYVIKPDLVAYGGNTGIHNGRMTQTGIKVIDGAGNLTQAVGTSFSTPWVARIAAELCFHLDGDFDPLMIKALMIHCAGYPIGQRMKMDDKKRFMGFGMPTGTRDILYNSEHEITLIMRDSLEKGNFIDILDFPFPKCLIGDDGLYHGQITLTMVSSPLLRPSEGPEYCQSDINVAFGTMEGIKERDTSKRTIRNSYGADDGKNLMADDLYSSRVFNVIEENLLPTEPFARERTLMRLGQKYYPIKKYAVDLDDMTPANKKNFLGGHRQWYMKVVALFRDAVEREAKTTGEALKQDLCIILTIRDPKGQAPVYTEITQLLQEKNFEYSNVQLRNEIRERVRIEEDNNG